MISKKKMILIAAVAVAAGILVVLLISTKGTTDHDFDKPSQGRYSAVTTSRNKDWTTYSNDLIGVSFAHPSNIPVLPLGLVENGSDVSTEPNSWILHLGTSLSEVMSIQSYSNDHEDLEEFKNLKKRTSSKSVSMCGGDALEFEMGPGEFYSRIVKITGSKRTIVALKWPSERSKIYINSETSDDVFDDIVTTMTCRL